MSLGSDIKQAEVVNDLLARQTPVISPANLTTGIPSQHKLPTKSNYEMLKLIYDLGDNDKKKNITNIANSDLYFGASVERIGHLFDDDILKAANPATQQKIVNQRKEMQLAFGPSAVDMIGPYASVLREAHMHIEAWRMAYGDDTMVKDVKKDRLNTTINNSPFNQNYIAAYK